MQQQQLSATITFERAAPTRTGQQETQQRSDVQTSSATDDTSRSVRRQDTATSLRSRRLGGTNSCFPPHSSPRDCASIRLTVTHAMCFVFVCACQLLPWAKALRCRSLWSVVCGVPRNTTSTEAPKRANGASALFAWTRSEQMLKMKRRLSSQPVDTFSMPSAASRF